MPVNQQQPVRADLDPDPVRQALNNVEGIGIATNRQHGRHLGQSLQDRWVTDVARVQDHVNFRPLIEIKNRLQRRQATGIRVGVGEDADQARCRQRMVVVFER